MNYCPRCGKLLVAHETVHAIDGMLYDTRACFLRDYVDANKSVGPTSQQAWEEAIAYYNEHAEILAVEEVLAEDLQDVQIAVTCFKTIKLPKCISKEHALEVAEKLWNDGLVVVEPDDCDDVRIECALVGTNNSADEEEQQWQ